MTVEHQPYFLYFPESWYQKRSGLESALVKIPFGGQYAVFGRRA